MFIGPCIIAIVNAKSSVFTEQDDRCGNPSTQSQAPEDGYINPYPANVENRVSS